MESKRNVIVGPDPLGRINTSGRQGGKNICRPFLDRLKTNGLDIATVNYITNDFDFKSDNEYDTINVVVTTVSAWTKYSELTNYYEKVLTHISKKQNGNKRRISVGSQASCTFGRGFGLGLAAGWSVAPGAGLATGLAADFGVA